MQRKARGSNPSICVPDFFLVLLWLLMLVLNLLDNAQRYQNIGNIIESSDVGFQGEVKLIVYFHLWPLTDFRFFTMLLIHVLNDLLNCKYQWLLKEETHEHEAENSQRLLFLGLDWDQVDVVSLGLRFLDAARTLCYVLFFVLDLSSHFVLVL